MGGCVSSDAASSGAARHGSRDASLRGSNDYRGATETLPEPWERTIRRGAGAAARGKAAKTRSADKRFAPAALAACAGYLSETEDNTVRAAMRYSLDDRDRASFAKAQVLAFLRR
jgi:hypothetical protein